jgi:hypothetical protein
MTRFKNALLDELVTYAQLSTPTARPARPRRVQVIRMGLASAGAGSLVAVAVAASVVGLTGQQAAYAVEKNHDGTVTITFRELADPAKATRDLRAAGVPAQVVQMAWPGSCATTPRGVPVPEPPRLSGAGFNIGMPSPYPYQGDEHEWLPKQSRTRLTINPSAVPAGAELFILELFSPEEGFGVWTSLVNAPAPTCWEAGSVTVVDPNGKVHTSPSGAAKTGTTSPSPSGSEPSPVNPSPGDPSPSGWAPSPTT